MAEPRSSLPEFTPAEWAAIRTALQCIADAAARGGGDLSLSIETVDGTAFMDCEGVQPPIGAVPTVDFDQSTDILYGNDADTDAVVSWPRQ